MDFISSIRQKVKQKEKKKILFPEGDDPRIIKAALFLNKEQLVSATVLGNRTAIQKAAAENDLNIDDLSIIDPGEEDKSQYIQQYYELRKHKGMTLTDAAPIVADPLFYAAFMLRNNQAEAVIAGAVNTTGNVLRAGIQVIGLAEGIKAVSSCFFMVLKDDRVLTYGDCAVIPDPDVDQLASIALSSAQTHLKVIQEQPNVAMLSFSTYGSAKHENVDKVIEATARIKKINPTLNVDGELQFDAAYNPDTAKRKAPNSTVAGKANVYIFPDLNAGNIGYKITERLAGAKAIGPFVQGLAKPFNDLSRGCSVEDVINTACICSLLA